MTNQPFFTRDRDAYIPTDIARGPWDPKSLHGRVIIGLLAFEIEQRHGAGDFVPARLTVDMFRLPNLSPIEVKTRIIRDGLRIKVVGAMGTVGPRRLWMSEVRDLVEGAPLTPFVRVAVAADFASPFANAGDQGLGYINSDVTLYLHRLPVKEWIGFEVVNHHATDGVAIGECFLYDQEGPIGTSTVAALAQRKPMPPIAAAPR
jgi:hypothetical protein